MIVNKTNSSNVVESRIALHHRPHLDELLALWMMRMFGEKVFPNVRSMTVQFIRKEVVRCYPDTIYIGIGHGEFDEHRPEGRLQNSCAALLVAQRLRLLNKPMLGSLVQEVLCCDTQMKGGQPFKVSASMLESLVKAMHRARKGAMQWETYVWAAKAIDAIARGSYDKSFMLWRAWESYLSERSLSKDDPAVARVGNIVGNSIRMRDRNLTELCSIVARMRPGVRRPWLDETFGMLVDDASSYIAAADEVEKHASAFSFNTSAEQEELGAFIVSDNEHVGHVMRTGKYGDAVITITRNSAGHNHIVTNKNRQDLGLSWFAQMVRMAEYRARTGNCLDEALSHGPGTTKEVPEWCFPFDQQVMNGSLTHPDVPPSKLTIPDLTDIAAHAFTDIGFETWKARYYGTEQGQAATA